MGHLAVGGGVGAGVHDADDRVLLPVLDLERRGVARTPAAQLGGHAVHGSLAVGPGEASLEELGAVGQLGWRLHQERLGAVVVHGPRVGRHHRPHPVDAGKGAQGGHVGLGEGGRRGGIGVLGEDDLGVARGAAGCGAQRRVQGGGEHEGGGDEADAQGEGQGRREQAAGRGQHRVTPRSWRARRRRCGRRPAAGCGRRTRLRSRRG